MTARLPDNPSLDKLCSDAATLRDFVRAGVAGAIELVVVNHPRFTTLVAASPEAARFSLPSAQLALARHYGFASWPRLVDHVEMIHRYARRPHAVPPDPDADTDDRRAAELVRLACLNYGADAPEHLHAARALLADFPHLATRSVAAMAATGQHAALHVALTADPALVNQPTGPFDWPPLLYVTYSRLITGTAGEDATTTARVLLDAGADANGGYLWDGLLPPFTALTGVFGRGEQGAEPHSRWEDLARLLFARGADANDGQSVYNIGLGGMAVDDTEMLAVLLDHGLGRPSCGPWYRRFPQLDAPGLLLAELLHHAAVNDLARRAELLLDTGVDPNVGGCHPLSGGVSPLVAAIRHGSRRVAALLERAGAAADGIDVIDTFLSCCLAGDIAGAADLAQRDPPIVSAARQRMPDAVRLAAELLRLEAIRLLAGHGFDVSAGDRATGLHEAALRGDELCVDLLLDLGADPNVHDCSFQATPAGWAEHSGHLRLAEKLRARERQS